MARKSIVLLKNRDNTLPLNKRIKRIAVVGPNANDSVMLWGNYNGFPSSTVTILEGIRHKVPGADISYEKGCDLTRGDGVEQLDQDISSGNPEGEDTTVTVEKVKDADVIIYAGGIASFWLWIELFKVHVR